MLGAFRGAKARRSSSTRPGEEGRGEDTTENKPQSAELPHNYTPTSATMADSARSESSERTERARKALALAGMVGSSVSASIGSAAADSQRNNKLPNKTVISTQPELRPGDMGAVAASSTAGAVSTGGNGREFDADFSTREPKGAEISPYTPNPQTSRGKDTLQVTPSASRSSSRSRSNPRGSPKPGVPFGISEPRFSPPVRSPPSPPISSTPTKVARSSRESTPRAISADDDLVLRLRHELEMAYEVISLLGGQGGDHSSDALQANVNASGLLPTSALLHTPAILHTLGEQNTGRAIEDAASGQLSLAEEVAALRSTLASQQLVHSNELNSLMITHDRELAMERDRHAYALAKHQEEIALVRMQYREAVRELESQLKTASDDMLASQNNTRQLKTALTIAELRIQERDSHVAELQQQIRRTMDEHERQLTLLASERQQLAQAPRSQMTPHQRAESASPRKDATSDPADELHMQVIKLQAELTASSKRIQGMQQQHDVEMRQMEEKLEALQRILKGSVDTIRDLHEQLDDRDRLITHQREVEHHANRDQSITRSSYPSTHASTLFVLREQVSGLRTTGVSLKWAVKAEVAAVSEMMQQLLKVMRLPQYNPAAARGARASGVLLPVANSDVVIALHKILGAVEQCFPLVTLPHSAHAGASLVPAHASQQQMVIATDAAIAVIREHSSKVSSRVAFLSAEVSRLSAWKDMHATDVRKLQIALAAKDTEISTLNALLWNRGSGTSAQPSKVTSPTSQHASPRQHSPASINITPPTANEGARAGPSPQGSPQLRDSMYSLLAPVPAPMHFAKTATPRVAKSPTRWLLKHEPPQPFEADVDANAVHQRTGGRTVDFTRYDASSTDGGQGVEPKASVETSQGLMQRADRSDELIRKASGVLAIAKHVHPSGSHPSGNQHALVLLANAKVLQERLKKLGAVDSISAARTADAQLIASMLSQRDTAQSKTAAEHGDNTSLHTRTHSQGMPKPIGPARLPLSLQVKHAPAENLQPPAPTIVITPPAISSQVLRSEGQLQRPMADDASSDDGVILMLDSAMERTGRDDISPSLGNAGNSTSITLDAPNTVDKTPVSANAFRLLSQEGNDVKRADEQDASHSGFQNESIAHAAPLHIVKSPKPPKPRGSGLTAPPAPKIHDNATAQVEQPFPPFATSIDAMAVKTESLTFAVQILPNGISNPTDAIALVPSQTVPAEELAMEREEAPALQAKESATPALPPESTAVVSAPHSEETLGSTQDDTVIGDGSSSPQAPVPLPPHRRKNRFDSRCSERSLGVDAASVDGVRHDSVHEYTGVVHTDPSGYSPLAGDHVSEPHVGDPYGDHYEPVYDPYPHGQQAPAALNIPITRGRRVPAAGSRRIAARMGLSQWYTSGDAVAQGTVTRRIPPHLVGRYARSVSQSEYPQYGEDFSDHISQAEYAGYEHTEYYDPASDVVSMDGRGSVAEAPPVRTDSRTIRGLGMLRQARKLGLSDPYTAAQQHETYANTYANSRFAGTEGSARFRAATGGSISAPDM